MWSLIIGAATTAAGAVANAISQSKAKRKKNLYLKEQEKKATDRYNDAMGDINQSASAQRSETKLDKSLQDAIQAANNPILGDENREKTIDSAMMARAEGASATTALGEQQRAAARQQLQESEDKIDAAKMNMAQVQAENSQKSWNTVTQLGAQTMAQAAANSLQGSTASYSKIPNASNGINTDALANKLAASISGNSFTPSYIGTYSNPMRLTLNGGTSAINNYLNTYRNAFRTPLYL